MPLLVSSGLTSSTRSVGATLGNDLRIATACLGASISGTPRVAGSTRNVPWEWSSDGRNGRETEAWPADVKAA